MHWIPLTGHLLTMHDIQQPSFAWETELVVPVKPSHYFLYFPDMTNHNTALTSCNSFDWTHQSNSNMSHVIDCGTVS